MAIIEAPNKEYTGVSASVPFCNGVGRTEDKLLIQWFKDHGYKVKEETPAPPEPEGSQKEKGRSKKTKVEPKEAKTEETPDPPEPEGD